MTIENDLRDFLLKDTTIGQLVAQRLFYGNRPEMELNDDELSVNFYRAANPQHPVVDVNNPTIRLNVWGKSLGRTRQLADAIIARLHRYEGPLEGSTCIRCLVLNDLEVQADDLWSVVIDIALNYY